MRPVAILGSGGLADDLSFKHLQFEMARIDWMIQRQIFRWQLAGQDPKDAFRGLYISDREAFTLLERPLGANWGQLGNLAPEQEQQFEAAFVSIQQELDAFSQAARAQGKTLRLDALAQAFGLDRFSLDVFLICIAPSLDLRYERLYGYLQDDVTRKRPTVNLALDLLCDPGPMKLGYLSVFHSDAPLIKHRLIEKVNDSGTRQLFLNQPLMADESVISWVLGDYQPHAELSRWLHLYAPEVDGLAQHVDLQGLSLSQEPQAEPPIIVFYGADVISQEAAAHLLAHQAGKNLLEVNLEVLNAENPPESLDLLRIARRDAILLDAMLYIKGWDTCLNDGLPPPDIFGELCDHQGQVILSGVPSWRVGGTDRKRGLVWRQFSTPDYTQRLALWLFYLSQSGLEVADNVEVNGLAGQFQLTSGQIRDAVSHARDWAVQHGGRLENAALYAAARLYSNPRLSSLARKIVPRYHWEDIVLPKDQISLLHEIVDTVWGRPRVLDEWGVGQKLASSRGVTLLFAGPPGTGKTMAAEVISAELGLDLYKIDLSTVVSKYIGETEKNLERIFHEAEASNAILFFDEADSLFGKRSEVRDSHDRYANIEISYLLQRMEAYDGVTIMATNMRANLDEAFTRRLQFAVDFPFPEEADRLRIWNTLFPPGVPRDPMVDFTQLSRRFKLAGGNIRNVIVSAAYLAAADGGVVKMSHVLHGTRRELQKMGRLVGEEDLYLD